MPRRTVALFGLTLFALSACGGNKDDDCCTDQTDDSQGHYGSLLNEAEFEASPNALPPEALTTPPSNPISLPTSVRLTNLPAIAQQGTDKVYGSPGSCEAQSFARGLGSYTAARNPDGSQRWDASQPQNEVSAAYMYRYLHSLEGKSCPQGSGATGYLLRLIGHGSPSAQDIPYKPLCPYLDGISLDPNFPNEIRFGLGSYTTFKIRENPNDPVMMIKKLLAAGNAVAFSGLVLQNYKTPTFTNGVIYGTETIAGSGHGQLVVGYDDTVGDPAKPGAFLIQNSFGKIWPATGSGSTAPPGMAWWSYDTFSQTQGLAATAYPREQAAVLGTTLASTPTTAPTMTISRANQWCAEGGTAQASLILMAHMSAPVNVQTVTITEPGTGTTVAGKYGTDLADGYMYFTRTDGNQFLAGNYTVTITALTSTDSSVTYTGTVSVGEASPARPPAAAVSASTVVTDSVGNPTTVTVGG